MALKQETRFSHGKHNFFTRIYHTRPMDEPQHVMVLVHGLGIAGTYMDLLARELAREYLVYVPDLPGFGYSSKPPHVLNIPEMGEALSQWAQAAGLKSASWLGNSTGCQAIVDLALHHPQRVHSMILQGPTIDPYQRSAFKQLWEFTTKAPDEPPSQVLIMFRDYALAGTKRVWRTFEYALLYETEKYLPRLRQPALVIRGEKDGLVSARWAQEAAELLPNGKLRTLPGAHTLNLAIPGHLARVSHEFLQTLNVEEYESANI